MINIGMCDDDLGSIKTAAAFLESELIEQNIDAEITVISDSQKEIFDAIYKKEIDVLFLDIDFKNNGKNGIDFAKDLRDINKEFYLVFLSAHQRYMHVSFFVKVFDYLIKPINKEIIQELVTRLKNEFTYNKNVFLHLNKWVSVRISDILYIEKDGNKSRVITNFSSNTTTKTLDTLLKDLPTHFRKSHRSYIVNDKKIVCIDRKNSLVYFSKKLSCPINSTFDI